MSELLLLLCPFCGTPPQLGMHKSSVWCKESSCWLFNKTIGIEEWNTRTPPSTSISIGLHASLKDESEMSGYLTETPLTCPKCDGSEITPDDLTAEEVAKVIEKYAIQYGYIKDTCAAGDDWLDELKRKTKAELDGK